MIIRRDRVEQPHHLQPILGSDSPDQPGAPLVCRRPLVGTSPIDGQYVPGLADRWEIAEDGKTYTFFLNPNVDLARWHAVHRRTTSIFSSQRRPIRSHRQLLHRPVHRAQSRLTRRSMTITVKVVATDVFAQLVFYGNAYCPIMPKHIWESIPPADWATDPGSTGQRSRAASSAPARSSSRRPTRAKAPRPSSRTTSTTTSGARPSTR